MLAANGVRKGDVVSLLLPNSVEYVIAYFACWQIGRAGWADQLVAEVAGDCVCDLELRSESVAREFGVSAGDRDDSR